jgi:hypothetical protein
MAIIATAFLPMQMSVLAAAPDKLFTGQPVSSPPSSAVPLPPTYPPEWQCPTEALGSPEKGFRWGTPYVPAGQLSNFTPTYTVEGDMMVLAHLSVHTAIQVRCPVVNSQNILTRIVTNWVSAGNTILLWVCHPQMETPLTVPGQQLASEGAIPEGVLENCGAGGSLDGRGSPRQ